MVSSTESSEVSFSSIPGWSRGHLALYIAQSRHEGQGIKRTYSLRKAKSDLRAKGDWLASNLRHRLVPLLLSASVLERAQEIDDVLPLLDAQLIETLDDHVCLASAASMGFNRRDEVLRSSVV